MLALVDIAMTQYFTDLYFDAEAPAEGRNCLYGYLWYRTDEDGNRRGVLPSATRSLKGWTRRTRQLTVDPVPLCVLCMLAKYFVEKSLVKLAMFVLIGFDTYLRPSELLSVRRTHVHAPARRAGPRFAKNWTLGIAPASEEFRTKTGLADVTIVIGDVRPWILDLFVPFFRNSSQQQLFPFDLGYVEQHFHRAVRALGLPVRITPHVLRHSGPSCDKHDGLRTLEEIRRRGQWGSMASVQRYERHASLLRSLNRLSDIQQTAARAAELAIVGLLRPLLVPRNLG